jgi:nitrogen regulatory protein PII
VKLVVAIVKPFKVDGKVWVLPVDGAVGIRTGEAGSDAI